MNWTVEYYSEKLEDEILSLPPSLLAKYVHYEQLMGKLGSNLGMPHTRTMGDGLFELRLKSKDGIARVFYCTKVGKRIIVLHSFIKKNPEDTKQRT